MDAFVSHVVLTDVNVLGAVLGRPLMIRMKKNWDNTTHGCTYAVHTWKSIVKTLYNWKCVGIFSQITCEEKGYLPCWG